MDNHNHHHHHDHNWVEHKKRGKIQEFIVHLLWAELEFDVKYGIIKRAKLAGVKGEANKNYKFTVSDEDWLLRAIEKHVQNAKSKLNWACKNVARFSSDELLRHPLEYNLLFVFDDVEWLGSSNDLMNYIHEYVTNACVAEWLEMEQSPTYQSLKEKAEDNLNKAWTELNHVIIETPKFIL